MYKVVESMTKMANNNSEAKNCEVFNKKERHIVSWSKEDDDILREQIRLHGTENWTVIASKFKDKSTRQCRRRWFTYLNSDFKNGGWWPEEDMLLCEAQRLFGNRWTEIAKVVPGRTDNAVKNRFTTLCKKRAKEEALSNKENINASSYINLYSIPSNGFEDGSAPLKKKRHPFGVLSRSNIPTSDSPNQLITSRPEHMKTQGTFLKRDDPKVLALMQQAELLTSLASKVNMEKADHSLESAWMAIQNHLKRKKESGIVEDLSSRNEVSIPSSRESDMYESSPPSSEYSSGSTVFPCNNKPIESQPMKQSNNSNGRELQKNRPGQENGCTDEENTTEFESPLHATPMFRALAAAIPSPKFSESEKHFLMKTLGMESPSSAPRTDPSRNPPCKRSLFSTAFDHTQTDLLWDKLEGKKDFTFTFSAASRSDMNA